MKLVLFILIFTCYIFCSIYFTRKIFKYPYFNQKQKKVHTLLLWLLPIVWAFVLKAILKDPLPGSANFSEERKKGGSSYYESGIGQAD